MLAAATTAAAADKPIAFTFATSGISTAYDGYVDGMPMGIAYGKTRGSLGNGDISIASEWRFGDVDCPAGAVEFTLVSNAVVLTAPDLSQLFAIGETGWMCLDPVTLYFWGVVEGDYPGGTGRFKGMTGHWTTHFDGYQLHFGSGYDALNGSVKGKLGKH
jgi:hypothetical protein